VVLNSPWLELQLSGAARRAMLPVVHMRARFTPHEIALPQLDMGYYAQAQREWNPDGDGQVNLEWRPEHAMPVRAAWLRAILAGHGTIDTGIEVGAPVCVLLSKRSAFGITWNDEMLRADTVLEVGSVARASLKLGESVTVERIDGALHDVFLSEQDVRREAFDRMERWLLGWRAAGRRGAGRSEQH
jgi:alpha-beta hydrolase superfamily lysophospholipase